jgi:hypothetical protein
MGVSMVKAAAAAAVSKYVFSGVYHPSLSLTNHAGKRPVEEALYGSGMDFTVLRPAMLMQTLGGSWPSVLEQGQIAMPYAKLAKGCYVDYRDVAEVATAAMTGTATGVSDRRLVLLDSVLTESPSLVGQPNTPLPLPHPADPAREAQGDLNSTTAPGIEANGLPRPDGGQRVARRNWAPGSVRESRGSCRAGCGS